MARQLRIRPRCGAFQLRDDQKARGRQVRLSATGRPPQAQCARQPLTQRCVRPQLSAGSLGQRRQSPLAEICRLEVTNSTAAARVTIRLPTDYRNTVDGLACQTGQIGDARRLGERAGLGESSYGRLVPIRDLC